MKFFLILVIFNMSLFSEPILYKNDIKPKYFNSVWKRQNEVDFRIYYDVEQEFFDIYVDESIYTIGFTLSRIEADALIKTIEKYKKWNIKASRKKITLEKEISKISVEKTFWKASHGDWNFSSQSIISVGFFSQTATRHQLTFSFPEWTSNDNRYMTVRPETLYFSYKEALKLKKILSKTETSKFIIESKKRAKIESEFQ